MSLSETARPADFRPGSPTQGNEPDVFLLRLIGIMLLCISVAAIGWEIYVSLQAASYRLIATGEWWQRLDVASLNFAQAIVQRYVHPFAWEAIIAPVLTLPLWLVAGVPGLLLIAASRPRARRAKPVRISAERAPKWMRNTS